MKLISHSIQETEAIARDLSRALAHAGISGRATVLALRGNLGAGKTALTKALGKTLGVKRAITSPTFVIEKIYKLPKGGSFDHLIHIDAYRLEGKRELESVGWDEVLAHHGNLIVIEWPEQVPGALPRHAFTLDLVFVNDTTRTITIPANLARLWPQKNKHPKKR